MSNYFSLQLFQVWPNKLCRGIESCNNSGDTYARYIATLDLEHKHNLV